MKARFLVLMIVLGLIIIPVKADTVLIVVGEPGPGQPGNSNNVFPFGIPLTAGGEFVPSMRYQQVYGSSAFGTTPLTIFSLSFRVDDVVGSAFSSVKSDIQINLSTTPQTVDGLCCTFASNVGLDDTIVVNRGPLALSSAGTGLFDITINFDTPFAYDPALGNLLLDIRNFGGASAFVSPLDSHIDFGDPSSRLFSSIFGDVSSTSGIGGTESLITQFTFDPVSVPEPGTLSLLAAGLLVGAAFRKRVK